MTNFTKAAQILLDFYEPQLRYIFNEHPKCNEIMDKIMDPDVQITSTQYDLWFAEAENYRFEKLMENRAEPDANGIITFERAD